MAIATWTTWRTPLGGALGLLLALSGCTCSEQQGQERPTPAKAPDAAPAAPKEVGLRLPSIHEQMKKIQSFTEEARRRVLGNVTVAGPARVVEATFKTVPVQRYPKNFRMFYDGAVARAQALATSTNPGRDYNLLVDRCVACHALHAQDYLDLVRRLKVPEDELPKAPPPPSVRPAQKKLEVTGKPSAPRSK